jgi:hypothetical protein
MSEIKNKAICQKNVRIQLFSILLILLAGGDIYGMVRFLLWGLPANTCEAPVAFALPPKLNTALYGPSVQFGESNTVSVSTHRPYYHGTLSMTVYLYRHHCQGDYCTCEGDSCYCQDPSCRQDPSHGQWPPNPGQCWPPDNNDDAQCCCYTQYSESFSSFSETLNVTYTHIDWIPSVTIQLTNYTPIDLTNLTDPIEGWMLDCHRPIQGVPLIASFMGLGALFIVVAAAATSYWGCHVSDFNVSA